MNCRFDVFDLAFYFVLDFVHGMRRFLQWQHIHHRGIKVRRSSPSGEVGLVLLEKEWIYFLLWWNRLSDCW